MRLQSYLSGTWQDGSGPGVALIDPVTGEELARASGDGMDLAAALDFARTKGGPALRAMSYVRRAQMLADIAATLAENRDAYNQIALRNSGNTVGDAAFDVDGGIGTLKYYAGIGRKLGEGRFLAEAGGDQLTKDENFRGIHIWTPIEGVAVHINAFNFPSWGLWEKAAVSLLAGVPFLAKPATATCWLSFAMVKDVIAKGIVPEGAISLLCGGGRDLMDHLKAGDVVGFTGSADTALHLRSNPNVIRANVRFAVEADSLNLCALGDDVSPEKEEFGLFVREIVRELTVKAGQKCTAIRRILVPRALLTPITDALGTALAKVKVGDPRDPEVRMGPLVSKAQQQAAWDGIAALSKEARIAHGGQKDFVPDGADPAKSCFVQPTILVIDKPLDGTAVHDIEVFGPVATVMPYDAPEEIGAIARRGGGSLVASIFTGDEAVALAAIEAVAGAHGRVLVVDAGIGKTHSGHGVVMPQSIHGGPGRAGGGEELGGLRGLRFYHQRTAIQGSKARLETLVAGASVVAF
jgi:3,4-dehydroadipyl-CoA semialdehyde dehydrogenase